MKKLVLIAFVVLAVLSAVNGQSIPGFSYQAVARGLNGDVIASKPVGLEISILKNAIDGELAYVEEFTPTTNSYGIINLTIGTGTPTYGYFEEIDWSAGDFFVSVAMDTEGGDNFVDMSTSQLLSVPYAMYAKSASSADAIGDVDVKEIKDLKKNLSDLQTKLGAVNKVLMGDGIIDARDGEVYDIVDTQEGRNWMADNLRAEIYTDGSPISGVKAYNDNNFLAADYGYLYTYEAIKEEGKDICPEGYKMPTDAEWAALIQKYGGTVMAAAKLKEAGTFHWDVEANNVTGEAETEILPAGMVNPDGTSTGMGKKAFVWTLDESPDNPDYAIAYQYSAENNIVVKVNVKKDANISIRCIKE